MKNLNKVATGIALSLSLGLAATVFAHQGQMGGNMGSGAQGGPQHGNGHAMQHGTQGAERHGAMQHGGQGGQAGAQLMTPEERTALREKMRAAATPEERQQIASATRAEMQKHAQEKGITLPEHRGPHGHAGTGRNAAPGALAPTTPAE